MIEICYERETGTVSVLASGHQTPCTAAEACIRMPGEKETETERDMFTRGRQRDTEEEEEEGDMGRFWVSLAGRAASRTCS